MRGEISCSILTSMSRALLNLNENLAIIRANTLYTNPSLPRRV